MVRDNFTHGAHMRYSFIQKGMTLLEIVIAMLIIGLGMSMSIAMIQTSVKNSISAHNQDAARMLLESIRDRMRINSYAATAYLFGDTDNNINNNTESFNLMGDGDEWQKPTEETLSSANPVPSCEACTAKQIENRRTAFNNGYTDVVNWAENVQDNLPGAKAAILELPANQFRVLIQWKNVPANVFGLEGDSEEDESTENDGNETTDNNTIQEASLIFTL